MSMSSSAELGDADRLVYGSRRARPIAICVFADCRSRGLSASVGAVP